MMTLTHDEIFAVIKALDQAIVAAVRAGEEDAALVDRLAPSVARDLALGRDGFGAVAADYLPARELSEAEKIERGERSYIRSRLLALAKSGAIRWEYIAPDPAEPDKWHGGRWVL